jgi:hypothetical protein
MDRSAPGCSGTIGNSSLHVRRIITIRAHMQSVRRQAIPVAMVHPK